MIIEGKSVGECWLKILRLLVDSKVNEFSPVVLKISLPLAVPDYEADLVEDLNNYLSSVGQPAIETTSNTIFPSSLSHGTQDVYTRFNRVWNKIKKDKRNRYGHYFRRLIAYGEGHCDEPVNQLKHITETYNGLEGVRAPVHRRSALIALTFDPELDHTSQPVRGFPCLQQVCFLPTANGTVSVNAIYAMQYLSDRAFGNYVGLIELGKFMASEMNLEFNELQCVASVLNLGKMTKSFAKQLVQKYPINEEDS